MNIAIIGAGEIGRAIEKILSVKNKIVLNRRKKSDSSVEIFFWDKNQNKVSGQKSLEEIIPYSDFIFLCVPSFAIAEFLTKLKPLLNQKTIIISLTKGIDESTRTMAEILENELDNNSFGLLCGPMLAEEIMLNKKSFAILAAKNKKIYEKTSRLFSETSLKIYWSSDTKGAAISSAVKNIYSVFFGICDELEVGNNFKGWFLTEILKEMKKIISFFGGRPETAESLAGLGDFFTTATSAYSKNYQSGKEIARTKTCALKGEGIISFNNLKKRLGKKINQFPLLKILDKILSDPAKTDSFLKELI